MVRRGPPNPMKLDSQNSQPSIRGEYGMSDEKMLANEQTSGHTVEGAGALLLVLA
jgi:hypothetical protein